MTPTASARMHHDVADKISEQLYHLDSREGGCGGDIVGQWDDLEAFLRTVESGYYASDKYPLKEATCIECYYRAQLQLLATAEL